jgi:polyphosphate kinase 2 (PPK2 family)
MLEQVDLTLALDQETYVEELTRHQLELGRLGHLVYTHQRPVVMVFEGWDASGKGGAIKRVTEKLDPRGFKVYPIAAPEGEDKTHHYLYRFWRRLPERGQIAIFDRSWYGRVMVERIEGFCSEAEWKRAYREINAFEHQLVEFGALLFKFWIHLSKEEQLRRFEERRDTEYKAWKLTEDDWRNRAKWDQYEAAVNDMLLKTSTISAPWTVVEGNDKLWARVKVLKTLVEGLAHGLEVEPEYSHADSDNGSNGSGNNKKNGSKKPKKNKKS